MKPLANSVSPETLRQGLKETPAEVYVIAAGEKIHRQDLTALDVTRWRRIEAAQPGAAGQGTAGTGGLAD